MKPLLSGKMDDWNYHYDWLISIPNILDNYITEYEEKAKTKTDSFDKEIFIIQYLKNCKKEIETILKNEILFNEHRDILPKKIR
jgi:hypothetical protein